MDVTQALLAPASAGQRGLVLRPNGTPAVKRGLILEGDLDMLDAR
jgi:hypothetical protein